MSNKKNKITPADIEIIFDNSGSLFVECQKEKAAWYFFDPAEAAEELRYLLEDPESISDWDLSGVRCELRDHPEYEVITLEAFKKRFDNDDLPGGIAAETIASEWTGV